MSHAICAPACALFDLPDVHVRAVERGPRSFTVVVDRGATRCSLAVQLGRGLNSLECDLRVTVDDSVTLVTENQSIYVPLGAVHRMENPGKVPMVLIEVQTGSYLGEDDIVRFDDVYGRS